MLTLRERLGLPADMYGHVVETEDVVVQFMLGADDTPETVDNVDAHLYLADGSHRYASFFTPGAVVECLRRWATTGEMGNGTYFWGSDQVIVPTAGVDSMLTAIVELIRSGDIESACGLVDES